VCVARRPVADGGIGVEEEAVVGVGEVAVAVAFGDAVAVARPGLGEERADAARQQVGLDAAAGGHGHQHHLADPLEEVALAVHSDARERRAALAVTRRERFHGRGARQQRIDGLQRGLTGGGDGHDGDTVGAYDARGHG
jgi:hypothetical protein